MLFTLDDCLYAGDPDLACGGEVFERVSRSGATVSVKCQNHQDALDERLDAIERVYPDSAMPPAWFDPTYAGETWDEDY